MVKSDPKEPTPSTKVEKPISATDEPFKVQSSGEIEAPQGTMLIVLVYGLITVVLWFWLYFQMLRFEGFWGGH